MSKKAYNPSEGRYAFLARAASRRRGEFRFGSTGRGAVQAPERKKRFFTLSFYSDLFHTIFAEKSMT